MSAKPEELPPIDGAETSTPVLRKPFSEDDLCLAIRAELTRASDLRAAAESEIVRVYAELSRLELTLQESRAARRQSIDLVAAARELRAPAHSNKAHEHLWRRPSRYTHAELQELRISRVHARDQYLFCLLSDRNMVRVPLTIAPGLGGLQTDMRAMWQVVGDSRSVAWYAGEARAMANERLSLAHILAHPEARMIVLPTASEPVSSLGRALPVLLGMLASTMSI